MKMFLEIFLIREVYFGFINSLLNDDDDNEGEDDEDPNDKLSTWRIHTGTVPNLGNSN